MFTSSLTIDDVVDAFANYITPFVQSIEIIRAQVNRVAYPLGEFVLLTEVIQNQIETPTLIFNGSLSEITVSNPMMIGVQVDIYGESSGVKCWQIISAYRSYYATDNFPPNIQPLYCSNAKQMPLIDAEEQYHSRWMFTAYMQYNPTLILPQESADELDTNLFVNVDTTIP